MPKTLDQRKQEYFDLSSKIAQIDTPSLMARLDNGKPFTGWGRNQTLDLDGSKVFLKRVPLTAIEQENMFSTANMHNLPTFYNYGIGSTGLGTFRELIAHIKTTNWVLNGEHENFPLLYHYRFVPFSGERAEFNQAEHDEYVAYWGSNENIGQYMLERANASVELLLFLEYIPYVLYGWLIENFDQLPNVLGKLNETIDFLHRQDILHLDAHYWNFLTDGERVYLTDFGLALDKGFRLSQEENTFFEAHTHYDYGELTANLAALGIGLYAKLPDDKKQQFRTKYAIPECDKGESQFQALFRTFAHNFDEINSSGIIPLHKTYLDCLNQYRAITGLMAEFFSTIGDNPRKDTPFPNEQLAKLLEES